MSLASKLAHQRKVLHYIITTLGDSIAPPRCLGCLIEGTWLCDACEQRRAIYKLSCAVCGKLHPRGLTCPGCQKNLALTGLISVGPYQSVLLQRGIGWLKFKGVRAVAPVLAALLAQRLLLIAPLQQLQEQACIIPIPLHPKRARERGFNQSELIALELTKLTGISTLTNALHRTRSTWTQSHLPHELRQQNMALAFSAKNDALESYQTILLVDDVATTGSTLHAAATALSSDEIPYATWGCTIARG